MCLLALLITKFEVSVGSANGRNLDFGWTFVVKINPLNFIFLILRIHHTPSQTSSIRPEHCFKDEIRYNYKADIADEIQAHLRQGVQRE